MADVFTQFGEEHTIDQLDAFGTYFGHWGTGAGTIVKGSTDLFVPGTESRIATADSQPVADQIRHVFTLQADGAKTITNGGVFTAASGPNLYVGGDHAGIGLNLNDRIEYTVNLDMT